MTETHHKSCFPVLMKVLNLKPSDESYVSIQFSLPQKTKANVFLQKTAAKRGDFTASTFYLMIW